ncbi:RNA-binding domain-containing protein [Wallemia mellicola]|nr:RNA-binding domain-containing protein [Wallemia mellicola]
MSGDSLKNKAKRTVWISNVDFSVNKDGLFGSFSTFGNILDIQLPEPQEKFSKNPHRGFGFIEYDNAQDASNAIDNMDMNILAGKVIKCNYAKPLKAAQMVGQGNRAIWSTEEWIQEYGKDSINKEDEQR